MLPIRDRVPSRSLPLATVIIIILNALVFAYELVVAQGSEEFFYAYGLIPCALTSQCAVMPGSLTPWMTILTSMFMHAGWMHFGGNMLYLWIFGNNVEDVMGSIGFTIFYLLCGVAATFAQVYTGPDSTIVNVGASGAIAGVLGAYLVLYPRAQVDTLVFLGWFVRLVALPAILVLGVWFLLQLFSGVATLGDTATGGVAFMAHVGGFVAGIVLLFLFKRRDATYY